MVTLFLRKRLLQNYLVASVHPLNACIPPHRDDKDKLFHFSEFNQTARLPVMAPVTTEISEACCVVKSGCESAHSMHLMYTPVMHNIMNLGSILSSNSFLATSSALISQTSLSTKPPKQPSLPPLKRLIDPLRLILLLLQVLLFCV